MALVVQPGGPLQGAVVVPGDKSQSHRALMLSALARGPVHLHNPLEAGVTEVMVEVLEALGCIIQRQPGSMTIVPPEVLRPPADPIHCGRSGTTMRLVMGLLAGAGFEATLLGDASLSRRPMERVADPLRQLGARIRTQGGAAPVTLEPAVLRGAQVVLPVPSAQVQSAVAFAALQAEGPTVIKWSGPLRDHTNRLFASLDLPIDDGVEELTVVGPSAVPGFTRIIPGDISSASFVVAATAIAGGEVSIGGVGVNPTRIGFIEALEDMGLDVQIHDERQWDNEPVGDLKVRGGEGLKGTEVHGDQVITMIDEFPVFAAVALFAEGRTVVRDAQELKLKESDRILALAEVFAEIGAVVQPEDDGFVIEGPQEIRGGVANARGDHRLAMALAVAALGARGPTRIEGADVLRESFPGFVRTLQEAGCSLGWHRPSGAP